MVLRVFQKSKKRNFVFVHINKTGGMSIEKALGFTEKQHFTAIESLQMIGAKKWEKVFKFSIVRNPWDKVVSQYFHRLKTNQIGLGDYRIDFKEWVKLTYGEQNPKYYDDPKYFMPQLNWLTDNNGKLMVDFIGRFENLENDFRFICNKIGVSTDLPLINKSEHKEFQFYYDDETTEIVKRWFRKDIETFKYEVR